MASSGPTFFEEKRGKSESQEETVKRNPWSEAETSSENHVKAVWYGCMASTDAGWLMFIDDVTENKSSRMNYEVFRKILLDPILPNAAKLWMMKCGVQMNDDKKQSNQEGSSRSVFS